MEDSEKTTDSMLLEEAMAETEKSTQEADAIRGDVSEDEHPDLVGNPGMVQDGALVEGVMESEDVEMPDGVTEDSENNNLAPEDSMDAPAAILEGEDGSEVSQGTISNSDEAFLGDQFISQTDSMIVQSEPPQQLMEEADVPGDGDAEEGMIADGSTSECSVVDSAIGEGSSVIGTISKSLIGEGVIDNSSAVVSEPTPTDAVCDALGTDQTGEELTGDEEALLLHQDEERGTSVQQDGSENVDLRALPEGIMENESDAAELAGGDLQQAEDPADNSEEGIVLHLEEDDEDGTEDGTAGLTLLAEGDQLEGALSELEGKIAAVADDNAQLTGQENLQGMQLMEDDDDKPGEGTMTLEGDGGQKDIQAELNATLLKQDEMKMEAEDQSDAFPDVSNSEADALATLASAALDHQTPTNGVKNELDESQIKAESDAQEPQWMDVGICKGTHCQVRSYYIPRSGLHWDQNWEGITTSTLPDHRSLAKLELESGKAYKFRVAAINSCGRGPWSEVAAFKTSLPGFPGAPSAIKIAKTTDGAHLSWEPPPIASGVIEDYHVYLAVRTATTDSSRVVSSGANQLAFVRIYQGAANQCTVGNETLSKAHIDMTTKPAILFRISARNEKGIGPATQVRWLQEVGAPNNTSRPTYAPRRPATEGKVHGNYKRKKSE